MKQSFRLLLLFAFVSSSLFRSPLVQAAIDDEDGEMSYEDIVKDLSLQQKKVEHTSRAVARRSNEQSSLDDVMIHGGVGLTQMFGTVSYNGDRTHLAQQGFQATLGIDLFSNNWLAEGTARNFTARDYDRTSVALKEFDLKVVYHNKFAPQLGYRFGGGLAARYMKIANQTGEHDYTTPASILSGGLDLLLSRNLTIGAELATRNALISETIDKSAYDMTLRLDANF